MGLVLTTNAELVSRVLRGGGPAERDAILAAVAATRTLAMIVDDILHALVRQARSGGHTWVEIGEVLHVTRQAAFQRFGGAPTRPGEDATPTPFAGAREKAREVLEHWVYGRWESVRTDFDARMTEACGVEMLSCAHREVAGRAGAFINWGTPSVTVRHGYTVVDLPMAFEKDECNGRVAFNPDRQISGFFVLPVEAS